MSLNFTANSKKLTLGVEIELQVLDQDTLLLTPHALEIVAGSRNPKLKQEFFQSTLELVTGICDDVHAVNKDLGETIREAFQESNKHLLTLGASGTHPLADYRERLVTSSERYNQLIDRNQWLTRRMAVYGMHIHLGMSSGDACIAYNNFFINFIPHILALSASSPFWQGMHTGLASCRPTTYEALPTAGMPYLVNNWKEFKALYTILIKSDSIQSIRDLWWDLRPSPGLGTLEIRCCDQPATLSEVLGITAFIHLLAQWFSDHRHGWMRRTQLSPWIMRENKWRALRNGMRAQIIVNESGDTRLLTDDIEEWLDRLVGYSNALRYNQYISTVREILRNGNSAERQVGVFSQTRDLRQVVEHNVNEFKQGAANYKFVAPAR